MHLVNPQNLPLSWISLGTTVIPRRSKKQWLFKLLGGKQVIQTSCIMVYVKVVNYFSLKGQVHGSAHAHLSK